MPRAALLFSLLALLFSGCVGGGSEADEVVAPVPSATDAAAPEAPGGDRSEEAAVVETVDVEVPFSVEGEAPSGIWICSGVQTTGQCFTHVLTQDAFVIEVPHTAPVVAFRGTLTFTPVTPNIQEMVFMVHIGTEINSPLLGESAGPSGVTVEVSDILVNATDTLAVMAWPVEDVDLAGPVWLNPLPQPFRVEGVVVERRTA